MDGSSEFADLPEIDGDFLNAAPAEAVVLPDLDTDSPARFFNRELSWLQFNWRVLEEASNPRLPLLERVKMLSISGTNLDEFYTVRVAGLKELVREGIVTPALDGLTPSEQLVQIDAQARELLAAQQTCWVDLCGLMEEAGIDILSRTELSKEDRGYLRID